MGSLSATNIVVAQDGKTASASITNNSQVQVDAGMGSYREFDNVIDNQQIFDATTAQIPPGKTVQLTVKLAFNQDGSPSATQIDLFCGSVLQSLNGNRYGTRLLKSSHLHDGSGSTTDVNWATPLPPAEQCGNLTDITGVSNPMLGKVKIQALTSGPTQKVIFELVGPQSLSHIENIAPYCFNGDDGTTCTDWDSSSVTPGNYTLTATSYGIFGKSLVVACNSLSRSFSTQGATSQPALTLSKSANPTTYRSKGQVIAYSYVVKNTGNVTLKGPVTVADDKVTVSCPATASLAPNASLTCSGSYTIQKSDVTRKHDGSVTNHATATAKDQNGHTVTSNQATVTVKQVR